jgi:NADH:ubiquinone reductase (non-electrogenic)
MFCPRTFNSFFNVHRIGVDEWLRVPSVRDVYAIGDCSGFLESTGKDVLPALAQVVS